MRGKDAALKRQAEATGKAKSHFGRRRQIKIALMQFLSGNRIRRA
jgi:hypothetical protein